MNSNGDLTGKSSLSKTLRDVFYWKIDFWSKSAIFLRKCWYFEIQTAKTLDKNWVQNQNWFVSDKKVDFCPKISAFDIKNSLFSTKWALFRIKKNSSFENAAISNIFSIENEQFTNWCIWVLTFGETFPKIFFKKWGGVNIETTMRVMHLFQALNFLWIRGT